MVLQMGEERKFFFSCENFTDGLDIGHTDGQSVGDCGMGSKYFRTLCNIPMEYIRR